MCRQCWPQRPARRRPGGHRVKHQVVSRGKRCRGERTACIFARLHTCVRAHTCTPPPHQSPQSLFQSNISSLGVSAVECNSPSRHPGASLAATPLQTRIRGMSLSTTDQGAGSSWLCEGSMACRVGRPANPRARLVSCLLWASFLICSLEVEVTLSALQIPFQLYSLNSWFLPFQLMEIIFPTFPERGSVRHQAVSDNCQSGRFLMEYQPPSLVA